VENHGVQLRKLPEDVMQAFHQAGEQAMKNLVATDPMAAKVYASFIEFYEGVRAYHQISEQAYINARDDVLGGN